MERGDFEDKIIEIAMREGRELPDKIANAPELHFGLQFFYEAFCDLSSCRPLGYGAEGFIPWTAMNEYCNFYGVHRDEKVRFFYLLEIMDREYIKVMARIRKQREKAGGS